MDKILLIVYDNKTRQLYHRALLSEQIEVVSVREISTAIMLLNLEKFSMAILDAGQKALETEVFLRLRKKTKYLLKVRFILLTDNKNFKPVVSSKDLLVLKTKFSNEAIFDKIKSFLCDCVQLTNETN